jgi:hypothetical protein
MDGPASRWPQMSRHPRSRQIGHSTYLMKINDIMQRAPRLPCPAAPSPRSPVMPDRLESIDPCDFPVISSL